MAISKEYASAHSAGSRTKILLLQQVKIQAGKDPFVNTPQYTKNATRQDANMRPH